MTTTVPATSESVGTVVVAGVANLAIAIAKLITGLISGSAAMLSEAAHSLADTVTEVFLYVALRRGTKAADVSHPFGYGKESYVWAFIAALFTFVGGAGFSVYHGIATITGGEHTGQYLASYIVLAVAFAAESVMLIAAAGLGLAQATGSEVWDGVASILVGLLLLVVATVLALSNVSLLVGRAVPRRVRDEIEADLRAIPVVVDVPTLFTMQIGPGAVLVAAKVDFADDVTGAAIEAASDEAERRLRDRYPGISYVFLDPTGGHR